jgi:hypothetical protein
MNRTRTRLALAVGILAVMGIAASCVPQAPTAQSWTFRANSVTVNDSQDAVYDPLFGLCVSLSGCKDEPYTLNIGFRVKIGAAGSAQAVVVNNRTDAPEDVSAGTTVNLTGNAQNAVTWANVKPLDVLDLLNSANKLEVFGVYSWASEEDTIGNGLAADGIASILEDALNATLAAGSLPSDAGQILDLVLDNIFEALGILVNGIPTFGLGDDVLGGALYIGIGAKGGLASTINAAVGSAPPITFDSPLSLPPDVVGGGIFTMGGSKTFTQSFTGGCDIFGGNCGTHTYNFGVSKN